MKSCLPALFLFVCLASTAHLARADVVINEFLSSTETETDDGTNLEWIEIYNSGPDAVSLQDYGLSDEPDIPRKWRFPNVEIDAGEHLQVLATGFGIFNEGEYHTNFQLNREGETLVLSNPSGEVIDSVTYPEQLRDVSFGRAQDGADTWHFFERPSPNAVNRGGKAGWLQPPLFSETARVSDERFRLFLEAGEDEAIYYTLDGSTPTSSSTKYDTPIVIQNTTVVRARTYRDGYIESKTASHSYIMQAEQPLPILTIVTDPDNLWDNSTGIYANPNQRGFSWERPCTAEFFNTDGQRAFVEDCGVRMHGGASRQRSPKKSFRFYFRSIYGKPRLDYPLFPNSDVEQYNQLVIRAGFNDQWGYDNDSQRPTAIFVSDQVCRDLHRDMGQMNPEGIWVELYVNGEYFGLYNPVERIEDDMFVQHFGLENWDVIQDDEVADGRGEAWSEFKQWFSRANFRDPAVYAEFQDRVDEENFITYMLTNIYMQNYDWPHHNWYAYRARHPFGKWRFMMWDVEYSFGSGGRGYQINQNTFNDARNKEPIGGLFTNVLRNVDFRHKFWRYTEQMLDSVLSEEHILERLNQHLDTVRPVIPKEAERWGFPRKGLPQTSISDWNRAVDLAKNFVQRREQPFRAFAEDALGPPPVGVEQWMIFGP